MLYILQQLAIERSFDVIIIWVAAGICTEIIYITGTAFRRIWHSAGLKVHSCAD